MESFGETGVGGVMAGMEGTALLALGLLSSTGIKSSFANTKSMWQANTSHRTSFLQGCISFALER